MSPRGWYSGMSPSKPCDICIILICILICNRLKKGQSIELINTLAKLPNMVGKHTCHSYRSTICFKICHLFKDMPFKNNETLFYSFLLCDALLENTSHWKVTNPEKRDIKYRPMHEIYTSLSRNLWVLPSFSTWFAAIEVLTMVTSILFIAKTVCSFLILLLEGDDYEG